MTRQKSVLFCRLLSKQSEVNLIRKMHKSQQKQTLKYVVKFLFQGGQKSTLSCHRNKKNSKGEE